MIGAYPHAYPQSPPDYGQSQAVLMLEKFREERAATNESRLRSLLERWVSGLTPAVCLSAHGYVFGLCDADAPIGSAPFILRRPR